MRVTTAIFTWEPPNNGVQLTGAASVQKSPPLAEQGESRNFISLYSGEASISCTDTLANTDRRVATRPEAGFAISIVIMINCARDEFLKS